MCGSVRWSVANEIKVLLKQVSGSTSEAQIGETRVLVDRPVSKGGSDLGPMGGELFLSAIGGCFMSNLLAAIKARSAEVSGVQAEVTAMPAGTPPRFTQVEVCVSADC